MEAAGDEVDDSVRGLGAGEIAFGFGVCRIHGEISGPCASGDGFT